MQEAKTRNPPGAHGFLKLPSVLVRFDEIGGGVVNAKHSSYERLECCAQPTAVIQRRPKGTREALNRRVIEIRTGASGFLCLTRPALKNMKGKLPRNANIDLGLAILASISEPPHTATTIAAYCGCSRQAIQQIEQKALRKLRASLYRDRTLTEAFEDELQELSRK